MLELQQKNNAAVVIVVVANGDFATWMSSKCSLFVKDECLNVVNE